MLVWNVSFVIAYNDGSIKNIGVVSDKSGVRYTAGTFYDVQEAMQLPKFAQFLSAVGLGLDPVLPASVLSYSYRVHAVSANGSLTVLGTNNTISPDIDYNNYSILLELSRDPGFTSLFTLPSTGGWQRPSQWLELPDVRGQQRFAGLFAIYPDANFLAVSAEGNYTVNWGDGNITNHSSGSTAYHEFTYGDISALNEDVLGFRQVVIQIYPQAGQNLTALNVVEVHNQAGLNTNYIVPWLDIAINAPSIASFVVSNGSYNDTGNMLQQCIIYNNSITNAYRMFFLCRNLINVEFDSIHVTTMEEMFNECFNLESVQLNSSSVTNMRYMFYTCYSLIQAPELDTSNVNTMEGMFYYCYSLTSVPLYDTTNVTIFGDMFYFCSSLKSVPLFNTISATEMWSMFFGCISLEYVPDFNTPNLLYTNFMLESCESLVNAPMLNLSNCIQTSGMFQGSESLRTIPFYDTSNVTNMNNMFTNCYSLPKIPELDTSSATTLVNIFNNCFSLSVGALNGTSVNISYANCKLSATQLNAIYTGLATVTAKTITVTGNYGTTSDNPTIATAKGWTVTS